MGALELAEVWVDGVIDGVTEGVGESDGVDDALGEVEGECDVVGLDEGGLLVADLDGDGDFDPPPDPLVPLGLSDGCPLSVGVGSSDVPYVPSGPGSVGLLVAVPVLLLSPFFALSAPRLSSSVPWLADGLTPTLSDGLSALLLDVAPRVTTVPRTAASRAPAPAATRLRRA
jgi:hypothetical protein